MASIHEHIAKNGTKTYHISVSLGTDQNGKKVTKSTTYKPRNPSLSSAKIQAEVQAFAYNYEQRILGGEILDGEETRVYQFVEYWKTNYAEIRLSERVKEDYYKKIEKDILPELGMLMIAHVKPYHINAFLRKLEEPDEAGRKRSAATVRKYWAVVSSIFRLAFKNEFVKDNPCKRAELMPVYLETDHDCFSIEQTSVFLHAMTLEYHYTQREHTITDCHGAKHVIPAHKESYHVSDQLICFFSLAVFSGCRRGELIALQWKDVDFDKCTIKITKSASKTKAHGQVIKVPKTKAGNRTLTLPKSCFAWLLKIQASQRDRENVSGTFWKTGEYQDENFIFTQENGAMMHLDTPTHAFKDLLTHYNEEYAVTKEEKLPMIRLHDLRHGNATMLIASNMDIEAVAKRLGHHKTSVTLNIYGHALKSRDQEASDILEGLLMQK